MQIAIEQIGLFVQRMVNTYKFLSVVEYVSNIVDQQMRILTCQDVRPRWEAMEPYYKYPSHMRLRSEKCSHYPAGSWVYEVQTPALAVWQTPTGPVAALPVAFR